ncbi:MAG: ATP-binding protein [Pseudomonadota bacterium]
MRLRDLSWRLKVPLAITAVIVLTEVVVTTLLVTRALADARRDLEATAESMTRLLARSLRDPLLRDDLWQAFEVISAPLAARRNDSPLQGVVVLDAARQVFVASDPRRLPVLTPAAVLPEPLAGVTARAASDGRFQFALGRGPVGPELAAAGPILADDGTRLGTVVLDFDGAIYAQRLRAAVVDVALLSVPGLLLLVPLGWYAGKRLAEPLAQMAQALSRVGDAPPERVLELLPPEGGDEVGRLSTQARQMLAGLARKAALEREVMAFDRLAAVGRVSAAIAHEINNPLGGMLNAIDTALRHGQPDAVSRRTLGLLERGLQQIRATVGALLVEARLDSPRLTAQDWDDLQLLIQPEAAARQLQLRWLVEPAATVDTALPAHEVRQLALNLLLNACAAAQAAPTEGSAVEFLVARSPGMLAIVVGNTGPALPPERLAHMFEPFVEADGGDSAHRRGLGRWVCWQITQRLGGTIDASSDGEWTRVAVTLPVPDPMPEG